jgi:glutathione synthase/RimK-type ligase-like ATP-grasp enzyme
VSAEAGLDAEPVAWEELHAGGDFAVLLIRSAWNYVARLERFLRWAQTFRSGPTRLVNSEPMIRWNCHKRYLLELRQQGLPVVESALVHDLTALVHHAQRFERVVVKPAVGCGALGCSRVDGSDLPAIEDAFAATVERWPEAIVQPYLESIEREGELSLVVIDGQVVRSVRKSVASGDWRVQREFGGSVAALDVDSDQRALAEACVAHIARRCGERPHYLRLDLMADDSRWLVSEIEMIEPVLYADLYPDVAERLIATLAPARGRRSGA